MTEKESQSHTLPHVTDTITNPFSFSISLNTHTHSLSHILHMAAEQEQEQEQELLQIHPPHITFVFELKKQSSCLVHLANNSSHHVAFKVKTTSPTKYCVRPTLGVVNPHGTSDFTVTMQAQRTAPPDFLCKDKFLVQTALVPSGTTHHHISSHLFLKDNGTLVHEKKLRVLLVSPHSSPLHHHPQNQIQMPNPLTVEKSPEAAEDMNDGADKDTVRRCVEKVGDMKGVNDAVKLSHAKDSDELKSRLSVMDAKLREAEGTILKLISEKQKNTREKDLLKQELELLKKRIKMKRAREGFPFLFVCMVSLVSVAVGYYIHP